MEIRAKEISIKEWVETCRATLREEMEKTPDIKFIETELYKSISTSFKYTHFFVEKNDIEGLFEAWAKELYIKYVLTELMASKCTDYGFVNDFIPLFGAEGVANMGKYVADFMNTNIELAGRADMHKIPKEDVKMLVDFFNGKSKKLPASPRTFDFFRSSFIMEAIGALEKVVK